MEVKKDYEVSIPSAFDLEYREGSRLMKIDIDMREHVPLLSYRSIRAWQPPYDVEPISDSRKRQIMENIISYLDQIRQFRFEVDGGGLVESRKYRA